MKRAPEQWRPVPAFDAYEVSDRGRVRRVKRGLNGAPCKVLKPWPGAGGAFYITLRRDNRGVHRAVRELQLIAFVDRETTL